MSKNAEKQDFNGYFLFSNVLIVNRNVSFA